MTPETLQNATITIQGLHCENCVQKAQKALSGLLGVAEAQVDLAQSTAKVRFDPQAVSVAKLMQAINQSGYTATGFTKS